MAVAPVLGRGRADEARWRLVSCLLLGATDFLGGSIGAEWLSGSWADVHGEGRGLWSLSSLEENGEMLGVFLVGRGLVRGLRPSSVRAAVR